MFFRTDHFRHIADESLAKIIAEVVNELVEKNGKTLYGNYFNDGSADNFSTTQEKTDSHVAFAIGIEEMGWIPNAKGKTIARARPNTDELYEISQQRNKALERNQQELIDKLRNKKE